MINEVSYDVHFDLVHDADGFRSRTEVRFACSEPGATANIGMDVERVLAVSWNGVDRAPESMWHDGRIELDDLAPVNVLVVDGVGRYQNGSLVRIRGGTEFVHRRFLKPASDTFCCFDDPPIRGTLTLSVLAPAGWTCVSNGAVGRHPPEGTAGEWVFDPVPRLSPDGAVLIAGPLESAFNRSGGDLDVGVHAASRIGWAPVGELARSSIEFYEGILGIGYPECKCDVVFVPDLDSLAVGPRGLVMVQDTAPRDVGFLAAVIAHEVGHAWFGGLVDMAQDSDRWVLEGLATYVGRLGLGEIQPSGVTLEPRRAPDLGYLKYADVLADVDTKIGRDNFLLGVRAFLRQHAWATATVEDLWHEFSRACGRRLDLPSAP